mmetsp:Transcript_12839/g.25710  ORF Transcript_12839/g.25710 Transcript_12839/m.25710 type:complete len:302 (-) Transcript_12839:1095-2000(-)
MISRMDSNDFEDCCTVSSKFDFKPESSSSHSRFLSSSLANACFAIFSRCWEELSETSNALNSSLTSLISCLNLFPFSFSNLSDCDNFSTRDSNSFFNSDFSTCASSRVANVSLFVCTSLSTEFSNCDVIFLATWSCSLDKFNFVSSALAFSCVFSRFFLVSSDSFLRRSIESSALLSCPFNEVSLCSTSFVFSCAVLRNSLVSCNSFSRLWIESSVSLSCSFNEISLCSISSITSCEVWRHSFVFINFLVRFWIESSASLSCSFNEISLSSACLVFSFEVFRLSLVSSSSFIDRKTESSAV